MSAIIVAQSFRTKHDTPTTKSGFVPVLSFETRALAPTDCPIGWIFRIDLV